MSYDLIVFFIFLLVGLKEACMPNFSFRGIYFTTSPGGRRADSRAAGGWPGGRRTAWRRADGRVAGGRWAAGGIKNKAKSNYLLIPMEIV